MRLPRRVPWAHISELEQVCSWIYADEADLETKTLAINRLSAWKAVTPLPHALDSVLAILVARMLDASYNRDIVPTKSALSLRQTYATAIIRMVNGLVDPLQFGAYARSIAAIAAQLGLPSWLVELRHAATHEDLPSLELLREASRESLSWLLHNYFQPALNPSVPTPTTPLSPRPVEPLLSSYKRLTKAVARDESLHKQNQDQINAVIRDIERWITEALVSAELVMHPLGWGIDDISRTDVKEKWALEILCDALLERGVIVPLSKRKCRVSPGPFLPTSASLALWTPLLLQLHTTHPNFPSIFTSRIAAILLEDIDLSAGKGEDIIELDSKIQSRGALYNEYLARWASWAARTWADESEQGMDLRKELVLQLAPIFSPGHNYGNKIKIVTELMQAISIGSKDLEECVELLRSTVAVIPSQRWQANDLVDMEERLQLFMADGRQPSEFSENGTALWDSTTRSGGVHTAGWRLLDGRSNWVPCPIGVYCFEP